MLAKIGSDMNKPNGHFIIKHDSEAIRQFMQDLPVRKIPSVGRVAESELNEMGVVKCKDIFNHLPEISICFGDRPTEFYMRSALGIARNIHEHQDSDGIKKSVSISETFKPITEIKEYEQKIYMLADRLEEKLKLQKTVGKSISVGFMNAKFGYKEKSRSLTEYVQVRAISLLINHTF